VNVAGMKARRISFGDNGAEIRAYELQALRSNEVLVKARCSLVSIGTETAAFRVMCLPVM
jgi:hypothetical protein